MRLFHSTRWIVAIGAIAAVAAGVSYAAIPSANGTINTCLDAKGGLKVIDVETGGTCGPGKQLLTWNQQGPQGAPGPQGPKGDQGPSEVIVASRPDLKAVSLNTAIGGIGQLNGKYLISAKLVLGTQDDFAIVHCWLTGKGTLLDEAYATVNGPGGGLTTISLTGAENSNNFLFTALVSCTVPSGGYAKNFVITATKVGDITVA